MSSKPRIGSDWYTQEKPSRVHIYNGNYDVYNNLADSLNQPWGVYRDNTCLAEFETFDAAILEAQRLAVAK